MTTKPYNLVPIPTELEVANAAARREIAEQQLDTLQEAIDACGPGATAYGRWTITDKLGIEPVRHFYCCSRPTHKGWQPAFDDMTRMTPDQHPGYEIKGVMNFPFRYTTGFERIDVMNPKSAEQLAEARAKREQKRLDSELVSLSLFAEEVSKEVDHENPQLSRDRV